MAYIRFWVKVTPLGVSVFIPSFLEEQRKWSICLWLKFHWSLLSPISVNAAWSSFASRFCVLFYCWFSFCKLILIVANLTWISLHILSFLTYRSSSMLVTWILLQHWSLTQNCCEVFGTASICGQETIVVDCGNLNVSHVLGNRFAANSRRYCSEERGLRSWPARWKSLFSCCAENNGNAKITCSYGDKYPLVYQSLRCIKGWGRSVPVLC